jgi:hypothetical protein
MPCKFPLNPKLNQLHSCTGGFSYYWDGWGWQFLPGASLGYYAVSSQNNVFTGLNQFTIGISAPNIVNNILGITGPVGISAGSNITISVSGKTLIISSPTVISDKIDGGTFI